MKIGVVTVISHEIFNYGNVLQAFALNYYIREKTNSEVYTIELKKQKETITAPLLYAYKRIKRILKKDVKGQRIISDEKKWKFENFYSDFVPSKTYENINEITNDGYNAFVVGADVVWHQEHAFINSLSFLDFGNDYKPVKMSYAASLGNEWIPKENWKEIRRCLNDFVGVSVRENSAVKYFENIGVNDVRYVLDPVFLVDCNIWESIMSKPNLEGINLDKFCMVYLLTPKKYEVEFLSKYLEQSGIEAVIVSYHDKSYKDIKLHQKAFLFDNCSPQEWLWLVRNCEMVVTDSFHGLAFSLIFEKKFCIMNRNSMMNRIIDLLKQIGLENSLVKEEYKEDDIDLNVEYSGVVEKLSMMKQSSREYLDNCLKNIR